jgi:class 3 adenylate cyclase
MNNEKSASAQNMRDLRRPVIAAEIVEVAGRLMASTSALSGIPSGVWGAESEKGYQDLRSENEKLREELKTKEHELTLTQVKSDVKEAEKTRLQAKIEESDRLSFLWLRVNRRAQAKLKKDPDFFKKFEDSKSKPCFVLAIDIRKSTELMLKARTPQLFSDFITSLCDGLTSFIMENYGVVDKFTGDGVLAFFPEFFSGQDAGFLAVDTAFKCHDFFQAHYKNNRNCFMATIADSGLGIGIDYGDVHLVKLQGALTIIGPAVVYACRLSGANPYQTLLNQPAYEIMVEKYNSLYSFVDFDLKTKHEILTTYSTSKSGNYSYKYSGPDWTKDIELEDMAKV